MSNTESRKSQDARKTVPSLKSKSAQKKSKKQEEEEENKDYVHRALVFSLINVVFRKSGENFLTFGKIPVEDDDIPSHIDWNDFKPFDTITRDLRKDFMNASIRVDGKFPKNGWNAHLFSGGNFDAYFFDRVNVNLTRLSKKEDEIDLGDDKLDDNIEEWADTEWTAITDFNLCWRFKSEDSLVFGKTNIRHRNNVRQVGTCDIKIVKIGAERLAEIENLPLVVDQDQGNVKWTTYLYAKKSPFFWYFNKNTGTLNKTTTRCSTRGGFSTRNQAALLGIEVSSIKEMNDVGISFENKCFPRERISGEDGCCAPIAAYYICPDLSLAAIENMKLKFHEELTTSESNKIHVTDGSYRIVQCINQNLSSTFLQQVYPPTDGTTHFSFSNALFGNVGENGKFLIELQDVNITSPISISHFLSVDTHKLEIYDPMYVKGAIVTQRNSEGYCLFLETLHLLDSVMVFRVWKIVDKTQRIFSSITSSCDVDDALPQKKKRKGKNRINVMCYR